MYRHLNLNTSTSVAFVQYSDMLYLVFKFLGFLSPETEFWMYWLLKLRYFIINSTIQVSSILLYHFILLHLLSQMMLIEMI